MSEEAYSPAPASQSKRMFLFESCLDSLRKKLAEEYRKSLMKLYGPVFESNPEYVDKINEAYMKSVNGDLEKKLQHFKEKHNIAQKLKELEDIAENPVEGVEKAWRPTGLSAIQIQVVRDIEVKVKMNENLKTDLENEEAELKQLFAEATRYREEYHRVKQGLEKADIRVEEYAKDDQEIMKMLRGEGSSD